MFIFVCGNCPRGNSGVLKCPLDLWSKRCVYFLLLSHASGLTSNNHLTLNSPLTCQDNNVPMWKMTAKMSASHRDALWTIIQYLNTFSSVSISCSCIFPFSKVSNIMVLFSVQVFLALHLLLSLIIYLFIYSVGS